MHLTDFHYVPVANLCTSAVEQNYYATEFVDFFYGICGLIYIYIYR